MAELNFGLLTPPGSQSIGNAFEQGMDQAASGGGLLPQVSINTPIEF